MIRPAAPFGADARLVPLATGVELSVTDRGATTFTPDPAGRHRYLILKDDAAKARAIEALVQLTSQPR